MGVDLALLLENDGDIEQVLLHVEQGLERQVNMVILIVLLVVEELFVSVLSGVIAQDGSSFVGLIPVLSIVIGDELVNLFLGHRGKFLIVDDGSHFSVGCDNREDVILSHVLNLFVGFLNEEVVVLPGQLLLVVNECEHESVEELIFEVALEVDFALHVILLDFQVVVGSVFVFDDDVSLFVCFGELVVEELVGSCLHGEVLLERSDGLDV